VRRRLSRIISAAMILGIGVGSAEAEFDQFVPAKALQTGGGPLGVDAGDIDGDGNLDFVVTDSFDDTVSVFFGRGDGLFDPRQAVSTGSTGLTREVRLDDLNDDGFLDIVTGNSNGDNVSVIYVVGRAFRDGASAVVIPTGDAAGDLVTGDFTRDGRPDIAVTRSNDDEVVIFENSGSGSFPGFSSRLVVDTGRLPSAIESGDFNDDGLLDLAVASRDDDSVRVLLGNGGGGFFNNGDYRLAAAGSDPRKEPSSLAVGDLNGDDHLDLVTSNDNSNDITILYGLDDAGFLSGGQAVSLTAGPSPLNLALADLELDDDLDIIVTNSLSDELVTLINEGGPLLPVFEVSSPTSPAGRLSFGIAAGDFNNDDAPDIVTASFFENKATYFRHTPSVSSDVDGDGLLNQWELDGLDVNDDGVIDLDLPAMGADPFRKDLFVEVDAMVGRAPNLVVPILLDQAFADAPVSNIDGSTGITLHFMLDETDLTRVPFGAEFAEFDDIKDDRYGTPAQRADPNWPQIRKALLQAVRYCIFADTRDSGNSSGLGEDPGDDSMVTLGAWSTPGGTIEQQAGTFMHELGHNLGLGHGGGDGVNYKPNYYSVMNYTWQFPRRAYAASWRLDYSRERLPELDESALLEGAGLGATDPVFAGVVVPYSAGGNPMNVRYASYVDAFVDWNNDGVLNLTPIVSDLNRLGSATDPSPSQTLAGYNDWANLRYRLQGHPNFEPGVHTSVSDDDDHTAELHEMLSTLPAPCLNDLNSDGVVGSLDLGKLLSQWGNPYGADDLAELLASWGPCP